MSVSVIAGLGNPGDEYRLTRHNVGFQVIEAWAGARGLEWNVQSRFKWALAETSIGGRKLRLVKPLGYMNTSGEVLRNYLAYLKIPIEDTAVIYDDITLDVARLKLSHQGGAGGHNGVQNLLDHCGSGFWRFRIGIGAKNPPEMDLADYVLGNFRPDEAELITSRMEHYLQAMDVLLRRGPEAAMNQFNQRKHDPYKKDLQGNDHPGHTQPGENP